MHHFKLLLISPMAYAGGKGDIALGTKRGNPATTCKSLNPASRGPELLATICFVKIDDVVKFRE